jgi:CyaY protein
MDLITYNELAKQAFKRIDDAFEDIDPDEAEAELRSDNISITFENGEIFIVNKQAPTRQIWLAALKSAYHFNYNETNKIWICGKTNRELFELLSEKTSSLINQKIKI